MQKHMKASSNRSKRRGRSDDNNTPKRARVHPIQNSVPLNSRDEDAIYDNDWNYEESEWSSHNFKDSGEDMVGARSRTRGRSRSRARDGTSTRSNRGRPYRSPGQIFSDIANVMDGWDVMKATLPNLGTTKEWHDTMRDQIVRDILMSPEFELYSDGEPTGPNRSERNMRAIAHRYLVFRSPLVLHALRRYHDSVFETQGFLLEITLGANRHNAEAAIGRAPVNITRLETRIPCWTPWQLTFNEGTQRARENPRNAEYYHYGYDGNCRGVMQCIIIHVCGTLGMVLNRLTANAKEVDKDHAKDILKDIRPYYEQGTECEVSTVSYETSLDCMNLFKNDVWAPVIAGVLQVGKQLFEDRMMATPEDQRRRIGITRKTTPARPDKLYLLEVNQPRITTMELLQHFFGTTDNVSEFWADMLAICFKFILRDGSGMFMEILEQRRFNEVYRPSLRVVLRTMYDLVFTSVTANVGMFGVQHNSARDVFHQNENYEQWELAILDNLRENPIRHLEQPEIQNLYRAEQNGMIITEIQLPAGSSDIVPYDGRRAPPPPVSEITDDVVDITASLQHHGVNLPAANQAGQQENDNEEVARDVTVVVVEDPPQDALDNEGKCKCCRIDWSKLNGRVQILRCPPTVNTNAMQDAMNNAVDAAGAALREQLEERQNRNHGGEQDDDNEDNVQRQQLQLTLPEIADEPQQVQMDVRVLRHLTRMPLQLLMHHVGGAPLNTQQAASRAIGQSPDILNNIFQTLLSGIQQRRITQTGATHPGQQQNETQQLTPAAAPEEVNIRLSETVRPPPAPQHGQQADPPTTTVTLRVDKRSVRPVIPAETVQEVFDAVGLGEVNRNDQPSFSAHHPAEPPAPQHENQEPQPGQQEDPVEHDDDERIIAHKEVRNENAVATNNDFVVEGLNCLDENYDSPTLLMEWAKKNKFHMTSMESLLSWASKNITCKAGPLSLPSRSFSHPKNQLTFSSPNEFIGTMAVISCLEMYESVMEIISNSRLWVSSHWNNRAVPYAGDRDRNGIVFMDASIAGENRPVYTAYSFAVAHVLLEHQEETQDGQHRTVNTGFARRLVYIYSVERRNDNVRGDYDFVQSFSVSSAQLSPDEHASHAIVNARVAEARRQGNQHGLQFQIAFSPSSYAGPAMKTVLYGKQMNKLPPNMVSTILGSHSGQHNYSRIIPFRNDPQTSVGAVRQYLIDNCSNEYISTLLQLRCNLINGIVPRENQQLYVPLNNYPYSIRPAQLVACLTAFNIIEENMGNVAEKLYRSPIFTIVGPAGTGKSSTALQILSMCLSKQSIVGSVVDIYDAIEHYKNEEHPEPANQPGLPPENTFRALIVTETNHALTELENMLLDGFYVMPRSQVLRNIVPLYSKVAMKHEEQHRRDITIQQQYEVPNHIGQRYTGTITMTTFGSLPKAFQGTQHSDYRTQSGLPQYDLVIIDEASQVDLRRFMWLNVHLYDKKIKKRTPTIIIAGDPYQQQPIIPGPQSKYTDVGGKNIMDHIINRHTEPHEETEGTVHNNPLSPWIQLNSQFRMVPLISTLSNAVASRSVFNHTNTLYRNNRHIHFHNCAEQTTYNFEPLHNAPLTTFQPGLHLAFPVVSVDPYRNQGPIYSARQPRQQASLSSFLEAAAVTRIIEYLFLHSDFDSDHILVVTPYTNQVTLIKELLNRRDNQRRADLLRTNNRIGDMKLMRLVDVVSVGSVQSGERRCVIFSTVRHARLGSTNSIGIAGYTDTVYVALTRARDQLIIVGDLQHLGRFNPWHKVASFFSAYNYRRYLRYDNLFTTEQILSGTIEPPPPQHPPPPPPPENDPDNEIY